MNASEITAQVKYILRYVHKNAWTIVFLIAGAYILYDNGELMFVIVVMRMYKAGSVCWTTCLYY